MKMGRYSLFHNPQRKKPEAHPLWRGVGCIIMVALPLITFGLTVLSIPKLLMTNLVPYQLLGRVDFPVWVFHTPFLSSVAFFIRSINNLWLGLLVFIIILVLLTGISSLIYVSVLQSWMHLQPAINPRYISARK
jgi:peptidoglycan/LPS O-acetylase OafA/YrhL